MTPPPRLGQSLFDLLCCSLGGNNKYANIAGLPGISAAEWFSELIQEAIANGDLTEREAGRLERYRIQRFLKLRMSRNSGRL
jgi:hypothetical protein